MGTASRRVLIIDDDKTFVDMVCDFLNSAGFESVIASNGLDGLKEIESKNPQAVILDINMPQLNGMQTCRLIRANQKYNAIPILMLTGRGDIRDMLEARKMGADDYLVKPFESEALIQKLERLFTR